MKLRTKEPSYSIDNPIPGTLSVKACRCLSDTQYAAFTGTLGTFKFAPNLPLVVGCYRCGRTCPAPESRGVLPENVTVASAVDNWNAYIQ